MRKPAAKLSFSSGRWPLLSCLSPWLSSNHTGRSHIQELQSPRFPQGSPVRQGVRDSRIFFSGQIPFQQPAKSCSIYSPQLQEVPAKPQVCRTPLVSSLPSVQLPGDTQSVFCFFFQVSHVSCQPHFRMISKFDFDQCQIAQTGTGQFRDNLMGSNMVVH